MRIRELAELTGNTPETIRYYEKQGLLPEPRRESNNYRQYGQIHVNRLDFIRHCRNLDIGLSEIRELLGALDEGIAYLGIDDKIDIALSIAHIGIGKTVELLRQYLKALGEQLDTLCMD